MEAEESKNEIFVAGDQMTSIFDDVNDSCITDGKDKVVRANKNNQKH